MAQIATIAATTATEGGFADSVLAHFVEVVADRRQHFPRQHELPTG
jgi:hypothetical protein